MNAHVLHTAALTAVYLLAACAVARGGTEVPDGVYVYEAPGLGATEFSDRISVSRDQTGIVVREDSMLRGGGGMTSIRRLDPATFSLRAYEFGDPPRPLLSVSPSEATFHSDRNATATIAPAVSGAPAAFSDFMPASLALVPAILHASGATSINLYSQGILTGDPSVEALTVLASHPPRPAGIAQGDLSVSFGREGKVACTIWYDPATFVATAVELDGKVAFRLAGPEEPVPVATVPITWEYGPLGVSVRAGTQHWRLMLDPDVEFSLDPNVAAAAGLPASEPSLPAKEAGRIARVPEIDLGYVGNATLHDLTASVEEAAAQYDGVIGAALFTSYRTVIDVPNRAMALYPLSARPLSGTLVPIELGDGRYPYVHATVGGVPATLAIVLASNDDVLLFHSFAAKRGLLPAHAPIATEYRGSGIEVLDAGKKRLALGAFAANARTYVRDVPLPPNPRIDGYIGLGLLGSYVMEFDYSQHAMALRKHD